MRVRIQKIVYPGRSLADLDGKVVFTDAGLPGETVEVEPVREKSSFIEARTVAVIEPSPRRAEPRCGHFRACSPWQEMEYSLQLEIKTGQVREIFSRELKLELDGPAVVPSPKPWGYRNRVRFHILREGGEARAAYHEPGEERAFVAAGTCYLLPDDVNALCADILNTINAFEIGAITDIEVRRSSADGRTLVSLEFGPGTDIAEIRKAFADLRDRFPVAGLVGLLRDGARVKELPLFGKPILTESVAGASFRLGPRSFFQVNDDMLVAAADEMRRVAAALTAPRIADLYCGVGTFGVLLAHGAKEVFGVEPEPENLRYLRKNLFANEIGNYAVCEGTTEEWIGELLDRGMDLVILDPPRRGIEPSIVKALAERPVPVIIYLSCNPATLARDLKGLGPAYVPESVKVLDFFPQTPHIETLVVLRRAGS